MTRSRCERGGEQRVWSEGWGGGAADLSASRAANRAASPASSPTNDAAVAGEAIGVGR